MAMLELTTMPRLRRALLLLACLLLPVAAACAPLGVAELPRGGDGSAVTPLNLAPLAGSAVQQATDVPSGRILYVRDGNLWLWEGGSARQFSQGGTWFQPQFSPDGKEIAYVVWTFNFADVFVMSADGSSARRLTRGQAPSLTDNAWSFRPTWAPDGNKLAFVSDATSSYPQIWMMAKDGGGRKQLTSTQLGLEWIDTMSWEPDGSRIAVTGAPNMRDPSQIWLVDSAKGTSEKLTSHTNGAFDPAWSPDGKSIAYISRSGSQGELYVRNLDGSKEAHVSKLSFVRGPTWSPDGRTLALLAAQGGNFQIWLLTVRETDSGYELGEPRQLTRDGSIDAMSGLTWAP